MIKKSILAILICTPIITHSMKNDDRSKPRTTLQTFHAARASKSTTSPAQTPTSPEQRSAPTARPDHRTAVETTLTTDGTSGDPQFVAFVAYKGGASIVHRGGCPVRLRTAFNLSLNASDAEIIAQLAALRTRYQSQPEVLEGFELLADFHDLTPEQVARRP